MSENSAGAETGATTSVHEVSPALARAVLGNAPPWIRDFSNLTYEWRRLVAEFAGTFLLILAGAGGAVVDAYTHGAIGRAPAVVAPALTVLAVVLAIGAVSGAHLNPVVSIAFALRREFPWRRIPLYVIAQVAGGAAAVAFLWGVFGKVGNLGATVPIAHLSDPSAMLLEAALTFGLVTTILGTASGAQNVGPLSAIGVAGYIALAGLWSSPASGASMNPVRSLSPDLLTGDYAHLWVYLVGPTLGMLVAVALAYALRGPGADAAAIRAAQGSLGVLVVDHRAPAPAGAPDAPAHE